MASWPEKFSVIDFYLAMAASHTIRGVVVPSNTAFVDIGSIEGLREAESLVTFAHL